MRCLNMSACCSVLLLFMPAPSDAALRAFALADAG